VQGYTECPVGKPCTVRKRSFRHEVNDSKGHIIWCNRFVCTWPGNTGGTKMAYGFKKMESGDSGYSRRSLEKWYISTRIC
jgi:hypothetical protein